MNPRVLFTKLKGSIRAKTFFGLLGVIFMALIIGFALGKRSGGGRGAMGHLKMTTDKKVASEKESRERAPAALESPTPLPHVDWLASDPEEKKNPIEKIVSTYSRAVKDIQYKVNTLRKSEVENEKLKLENANLRMRLEAVRFDCEKKQAEIRTSEMSLRLAESTGTKIGRTLATMEYRAPVHLPPQQLYTLGVTYFRAGEDEKAAVIFSLLTEQEDNDTFKTAKNYLMTAVAWYRLDNLELADHYLDKILKQPDVSENLPYQAQARLWRGLVAKRLGKRQKAQEWLRDLIDHHPHSTEAGWINPTEVERAQAASESED